jgi:O-acetyl-ADP-ribose deacetylase
MGGLSSGRGTTYKGLPVAGLAVIHTVGPLWKGGAAAGDQQVLGNCYRLCIEIARSEGFRDIAFPAIATGVYGFRVTLPLA